MAKKHSVINNCVLICWLALETFYIAFNLEKEVVDYSNLRLNLMK